MISFRCDCTKIAPLFLIRLKYFGYRYCKCSYAEMLKSFQWQSRKEECRRTGKSVISVAMMMCSVRTDD